MNDKTKLRTGAELNDKRKDLEDIASIFEVLNLRFFLIDGVLLGAIREENFIKWDWDVELAIFEEEVMPNATKLLNALFDSGFEILNVNPFSSFFKINIKKRGTKFSLVGLKKSRNKWRYRSHFRYPLYLFDNAKHVKFLGKNYLAPFPAEEMLTCIYGQWEAPLRSSKQSEYLNRSLYMPKFLTLLIKIKHIIVEFDSYFLRLKMGITSKVFPERREYLFSNIMLKKALSEDCVFLEIGSSDGLEMSNAIEFTNGKLSGYLIEPSIENLEKSKKRIEKKSRKYNVSVCYINKVVSSSNENIDYYFSSTSTNLSGISAIPKDAEKRQIKSTTIKEFLSKENISLERNLVIKLDVEGAEVEILKSSIDLFSQMPNVSILLEVHQSFYKGDEMKEVLGNLFSIGFNASIVETAWVKSPDMFVDSGYKPIATYNNKSLYDSIDNNMVLTCSSKEILNMANITPFFTKKIVRSILIKKRNK